MKKHHFILLSSLVFLVLFYNESIGLNLSLFGLTLLLLIVYRNLKEFKSRTPQILAATSFLSCLAFAWYGDFVSFLAIFVSLTFLQIKVNDPYLKMVQSVPIAILNGFSSSIRIFYFSQWLPERKIGSNYLKILIAYIFIPVLFLGLFFLVYSFGSNTFSSVFTNYSLDIEFLPLILTTFLGFYISFSFWNYFVPEVCVNLNHKLDNEFKPEEIKLSNTFHFLDVDFERKSGEITLVLLNILLLVFIATYNYEQFFQEVSVANLSQEIHERVNAIIFSIIMALGVLLFYFKGGFNFDPKSKNMKLLAKVWLVLNGILILSAVIKNSEYILHQGLTYKRLGVYAFLGLSVVGLVCAFIKIQNQKKNAYLFNQMIWYFYGLILLCSYFNWGNFITKYNIAVEKGTSESFLHRLDYNDAIYLKMYPEGDAYYHFESNDTIYYYRTKEEKVIEHQNESLLSKALYYEMIDVK